MLKSLNKSFNAYKKHPFIFIWGSLIYILMLVVFLLAAIGFFLIYFMGASLANVPVDIDEIPTMIVLGLIIFVFLYFISGLSAGLAMTYRKALTTNRTSLAEFYAYAIRKAPVMFGILILRDVLTLLVVGPAAAVYFFFLENVEFMDAVLAIYALFWIFVFHCIFTPAFVAAGAFDESLFQSMHRAFRTLKTKHISYIGLFIVFALMWLLNFIPLIQLATLFFLYPVIYTAIIVMMGGAQVMQEE
ncbi:MAG: hypothetical protein ABII71_05605 [Candidatus Micrarchaeota archaeon]